LKDNAHRSHAKGRAGVAGYCDEILIGGENGTCEEKCVGGFCGIVTGEISAEIYDRVCE
jgi:hypothetical protein